MARKKVMTEDEIEIEPVIQEEWEAPELIERRLLRESKNK